MRVLNSRKEVPIPEGVSIEVRGSVVTVTGDKGSNTRDFSKNKVKIYVEENKVVVELWFAKRKRSSTVAAVSSHIRNMMTGCKIGFRYVMKFVYAHFPINFEILRGGTAIRLKKFLGEKDTRLILMEEGCIVAATDNKDEIKIEGIDLEKVSKSASLVNKRTKVRDKDIRKFLDGIYVSTKENMVDDI